MNLVWIVFLLLIGVTVGSFLNVVIHRLPRGQSIVFPSSHCPHCGRKIRWYDNIPVLSYFLLGRRCRFCKMPISPRYVVVEVATAFILTGLYVCYYVLRIRNGIGPFADSWGMFTAHAVLLCGLLACSFIDAEHWIVPLEICWVVSIVGVVCAAAGAHPFWSRIPPTAGAMSLAAVVGLAVALLLKHAGIIRESFIDADEKLAARRRRASQANDKQPAKTVAYTSAHGLNPRKEILMEVLFLLPIVVLALVTWGVLVGFDSAAGWWAGVLNPSESGAFAVHANAFLAALFGYLIGGACVWGMRITGTVIFGKEAMGLGDVHILAAVGAATGWVVPVIAFFLAPFFALLWAVYLWLGRRQRELPYGPWLGLGTVVVMLFYDALTAYLQPLARSFELLFR